MATDLELNPEKKLDINIKYFDYIKFNKKSICK